MNIGDIHISKRQILAITLLLTGLIVGIYLVQTKQIFRSRATDNLLRRFSAGGQGGEAVTSDNNGNFTTSTLNVTINFANPGSVPGDGSTINTGAGSTSTVDPCNPEVNANYDRFVACDNTKCGSEIWSCASDPNITASFQHDDPGSGCYQPENNSACPPNQ